MIGRTISHYCVLDVLGRGGMGVVYRAEDVRLKRLVALKFLSDDRPFDDQALERFRWEAQALSALNHPNICTIYDVGEADGRPFMVMELLEGRSLREAGRMSHDQVVDVGIQIADALDAAHSRDIIHRDLKPANIFLTGRGQAKLLDFGLAKAVAARAESESSEAMLAETGLPQVHTSPGHAVGTAGYMAPEQVRGEEVDARTDLFALGAVLYELVTGRPPFAGRTLGLIHDAVLNRSPIPPSQLVPAVPPKLEEIIDRALEKEPDLRYQTAADLRADLRRVLRDRTTLGLPAPTVGPPRRRPRGGHRTIALAGAAAAVVLGAALWSLAPWAPDPPAGPPPRLVPFTTLPGLLRQPDFSPDGNQIAFAWNGGRGESFDVYTQLVDAGAPLRLTSDPGDDGSPTWSPDARFIAFRRQSGEGSAYVVVPALGGAERRLRPSYDVPFSYGGSIDWSPDARQLAVVDRERPGGPLNILLLDVEGGGARTLLDAPLPYLQNPRFSADGKLLAFVGGRGFLAQDIYVVQLPAGAPRRLTTDGRHIAGITWGAGGREILFSSNRGGLFAVWTVPLGGGEPALVNAVGEDAYAPTLAPSGHLAFVRLRVDWNIWRVPGPAAERPSDPPVRLIHSTREEWQPAYSPDDRHMAFVSSRSGSQEIWVATSEGADAVQITAFRGPPTGTPRWSPDGSRIAADSRLKGDSDIFVMSRDGANRVRLTTEPSEDVVPSWSRDGRSIYFSSDRGGRERVWKVAAAGGEPTLAIDTPARDVFESRDGRLFYWRAGAIWSRPIGGGAETRVTAHPRWGSWVLRDEGLYMLHETARPTIEFLSFATGRRTAVRELEDWPRAQFPPAFDSSHDGRWFVFGRVDQVQSDVMLIQHFR